jgi:Excreted virulence factor EspC, type VII ESX diderm
MSGTGFEAQPDALRTGAGHAAALSSELRSLRGVLNQVSGDAASGPPGAHGAVAGACEQWAAALDTMAERAAELDRNLHGAAGAYETTDRQAMPGSAR